MAYRREVDNRGCELVDKGRRHTADDRLRNIRRLGLAGRSRTKVRLWQVGTRVNGHLVTCRQRDILTFNLHIAVGRTDGDARKSVDTHGT